MYKAKVLGIKKCNEFSIRKRRIVLDIEYMGVVYYLDVTDDLREYGIEYEFDIEKLRGALPDYICASFSEPSFRISKSSLKKWMIKLNN